MQSYVIFAFHALTGLLYAACSFGEGAVKRRDQDLHFSQNSGKHKYFQVGFLAVGTSFFLKILEIESLAMNLGHLKQFFLGGGGGG